MPEETYDLIVIGAGPGGYVAAIRAAQLGMRVAVVEKRDTLGGVCLNEGCIPSKALLDSSELFVLARDKFGNHGIEVEPPRLNLAKMMARKNDVVKKLTDGVAFLFKKNKVVWVKGTARLSGKSGDRQRVEVTESGDGGSQVLIAPHVLIATGSDAAELPFMPFDGETVVSAREALSFEEVPGHLLVVGAGYIGLELGSVWRRLGAEVTVVEVAAPNAPDDGRAGGGCLDALPEEAGHIVPDGDEGDRLCKAGRTGSRDRRSERPERRTGL